MPRDAAPADPGAAPGIVVCIPVFNDWACALMLLERLDAVAPGLGHPVHVVLVDDGSDEPPPATLPFSPHAIAKVEILSLRRNVGHQRAIALGLGYVHEHCTAELVVVMDADGEDDPGDVAALVERCRASGHSRIVFAQRRRRTEHALFRAGYAGFKALHRLLTGQRLDIGNFSVIPGRLLPRVAGVSEIWNHYAAGLVHARLPVDTVPVDRARRLAGESKMDFVALVTHGMSAISVHGDTVGVRLLCVAGLLSAAVLAGLGVVVSIRTFTELAIPGWATNAFGILAVILLNLLVLAVAFVLFVLQSRNVAGFLPLRDWKNHVAARTTVHEHDVALRRL